MNLSEKKIFISQQAVLALALWAVYLKSSSPAFPPDDSPETAAAAMILGIQHPPGYPLAALLGRCAILSLPLASPAWRVNCLSACLAILGCLLVSGIVKCTLNRFWPAISAPLCLASALASGTWLGLSKTYWQSATAAKGGIYLLNGVLFLGLLYCLLELFTQPRRIQQKRALRLFALLAGLSLANHYPSALVCMAVMALPLAFLWKSGFFKGRRIFSECLFFAAGLSLYFYLPLRAIYQPSINAMDNPLSWHSFWWILLRRGYSQAAWAERPGLLALQVQEWWKFLWEEGGLLLPLAALWGAVELFKVSRWMTWLLGGTFLAVFVAVVLLNRNEPEVIWIMDNFLMPGHIVLCILAGIGLSFLLQGLQAPEKLRLGLACGVPLLIVLLRWNTLQAREDRSQDYSYYDFARGVLNCLPEGSIYFPEGDFYNMPIRYLQAVEQRRPDVTMISWNRLLNLSAYMDLKRLRPEMGVQPISGMRPLQCLLHQDAARAPFCVGTYHESLTRQDLDEGYLLQRGLVASVQEPGPLSWPSPYWGATLPLREDQASLALAEPAVLNLMRWYRESWKQEAMELRIRSMSSKDKKNSGSYLNQAALYLSMAKSLE